MKKIEVPFLRQFDKTWHWQPSAAARKLGFVSVALGTDAAVAVEKAGNDDVHPARGPMYTR